MLDSQDARLNALQRRMSVNLNLSYKLKKLRKERDMTQEEVASRLGVTYQSVSRWENGLSYPDIALLPVIASLFGVSLDQLFGMDEASEQEEIRKLDDEDRDLSPEERISRVKQLTVEFPNSAYLKFRLMEAYHIAGPTLSSARLEEMRTLCRYVIAHIAESGSKDAELYRDEAISYMIDVEETDRVGEWCALLDHRSRITSLDAMVNRYDYQNDVDMYNYTIQWHLIKTMTAAFRSDFCKRDAQTYKNAKARVDGQLVILKIMDAMGDPEIEMDGWVFEREFAYRRLAAGYFGAGQMEAGYSAMEKSIGILEKVMNVPDGTVLVYHCPALDLSTTLIQQAHRRSWVETAIWCYTESEGWAWFQPVREEKRFLEFVSRLKSLLSETVSVDPGKE